MLFAPAKTQFSFTLQWAIATFSGFVLSLLFIEIGEKPDVGILQAFIGSLAIASAQMLILKNTGFAVRWLFFTVSAWIAIAVMGVGVLGWYVPTIEFFPLRILNSAFYGTLGGLVLGIAQWLAIYQYISYAWRWIFISAVSWAIALSIGSAIGIILRQISEIFLGEVIGLAIGWLAVAIFTGMNMYILVNDQ